MYFSTYFYRDETIAMTLQKLWQINVINSLKYYHFCFEASCANLLVMKSVESTNLAAQFAKQLSLRPKLLLIEGLQVSQQISVML